MNEIVFEVTQEADGGFVAECLTESIFTQLVATDSAFLSVGFSPTHKPTVN